jgi:hypothetical protein
MRVEDHDVGRLINDVEQLQYRLREFVDRDRFAELIPIFKKPGWTTPAEFYLVSRTIDTISRQLEIVDYLTDGLIEGAGMVSVEERAAVS